MRTKLAIALTLLFITVAASFWYFLEQKKEQVPLPPVTLGWIGPLTGPVSGLGVANLNAVKLALSEYQATKATIDPEIRLVMSDDEYNFKKTDLEYEAMVRTEHPQVIMISTYSGLLEIASKALKDSILIIDPIDNDKVLASINRNIFLIAKETEDFAGILANALIDHNKKNVFILYNEDDNFMLNVALNLSSILQKNKVKISLYNYHSDEHDFHPFLEAGKADNSDGFVFFGYSEIGLAMKQAREIGITAPFYASNNMNQLNQIVSPKTVDRIYIPDFTSANGNQVIADEFLNNYIKKYHSKPHIEWTAMQAYDAAKILFKAIKTVSHQPGVFFNNLREELLSTSNYEGVSGNITILPSGASRGIYFSLYVLKSE